MSVLRRAIPYGYVPAHDINRASCRGNGLQGQFAALIEGGYKHIVNGRVEDIETLIASERTMQPWTEINGHFAFTDETDAVAFKLMVE